eukprot:2916071-Amphidinium_carterae.1
MCGGRLRRQKDPLTVLQVAALEKYLSTLTPGVEACALGQLLFISSRLRKPTGDGYLISAESKLTKTSRGIKRLRVPVPFLALTDGVSGYDWGRVWLASRQAYAISSDPSLQSVDAEWAFVGRSVSSDEAHVLLLHFLSVAGTPPLAGQNLGSHSLKATLLAWAARWPMKSGMRT